jgi:radical SAM protein with 4Fe4S-binding SPASM domain
VSRVAPGLVRLRRGHAPNCSSAGAFVGVALGSAVVAAALMNAFASRFLGDDPGGGEGGPRLRPEPDGGVLHDPETGTLLQVDTVVAERLVQRGVPSWGGAAAPAGALSAPTEVHFAVTERCPAACDGCYLDAGPDRGGRVPERAVLFQELEALAEQGVFEVAFGGGEALLRDDVVALCAHARGLGLVPNLTTSGFGLTPELAARLAPWVGQVNVSVDGLGADYVRVRGWDGTDLALKALATLQAAGIRTGVNTVLSRRTFDGLAGLGARLAALGVREWQWLRLKPTGRGADVYSELALTPEQALGLWPLALEVERGTGLLLRWDCALVPWLAVHDLPVERLTRLGVTGCTGGETLLARHADGTWAPCSFVPGEEAAGPAEAWISGETLLSWRGRAAAPPEPCASCDHRTVCRGGCRAVASFLTGDPLAPDPECPRVRA